MKNQGIRIALALVFRLAVLAVAYRAGVMSGGLVLARLTSEMGRHDPQLSRERQKPYMLREVARMTIRAALLEAQFSQQHTPGSDHLPHDRVRALHDRLEAGADRSALIRLKPAARGLPRSADER